MVAKPIKSLVAGLKTRMPGNARDTLAGIHATGRFRDIVERERARADRNAHNFSLVLFEVGNISHSDELAAGVVKELNQRIRFTDEVGLFDERRVGVLLPETGNRGAQTFAENICVAVRNNGHAPGFTVHSYPVDSVRDDDPHQLWFDDPDYHGGATGREPDGAPNHDTPSTEGSDVEHRVAHHPLSELAPYLVRPLPPWKRALDIVGSGFGLVFLSPVFAVMALLIKVVSPGPVFFKQLRVGFLGRSFTCWKFRTMHLDADVGTHQRHFSQLMQADTPMMKLDGKRDPRIIPLGRLFRVTGLDELPQLVNVLKGDMSLIGPRPCIAYESREYARWQRQRFDTIPGLTGLWQVSGKNRTTFNEMMRMDASYAREKTLWMDIKILFKTIPALWSQVLDHMGRRHPPATKRA